MRAAVDIGTNSMRLLVVDDDGRELERVAKVTGLGSGVDASGRFSADAVERTVEVLADYGGRMRRLGVDEARAVATSASRDVPDRDAFLDRAEEALGVRPEVITGEEEAGLSFAGATADAPGSPPYLVVDVGGGSTEFVWREGDGLRAVSVDIGSVRITDRLLDERPVPFDTVEQAMLLTEGLFIEAFEPPTGIGTMIGVAGTWTSLAAIALVLPAYDRGAVHHSLLRRIAVDRMVERLAGMTIEETAGIPALDPARAPVILGGAIVAREAMRYLGVLETVVSEHDLLDGIVASLAG